MEHKDWKALRDAARASSDFALAFAKGFSAKVIGTMTDGPEKKAAEQLLPLFGRFKQGVDDEEFDAVYDPALHLYQSHLVDGDEDDWEGEDPEREGYPVGPEPECGWDNFLGLGVVLGGATFPWKATEEVESELLDRLQSETWERMRQEWAGRISLPGIQEAGR